MNAQEVGIIEYVSDGAGFSAVCQSSDFQVTKVYDLRSGHKWRLAMMIFVDSVVKTLMSLQVHEISLEGKEIHLTDKRVPESMDFHKIIFGEYPSPEEQSELLTAGQWNEIEGMIKNEVSQTVKIDVSGKSRDERQNLRRVLSVKYGGLSFKTFYSILEISKLGNMSAATRDPPPVALYIQFVLYKENLSTSSALAKLNHGRKQM